MYSYLYTIAGYNSVNYTLDITRKKQFSIRKYLSIITDCLESLFVEIINNVLSYILIKTIIVGLFTDDLISI